MDDNTLPRGLANRPWYDAANMFLGAWLVAVMLSFTQTCPLCLASDIASGIALFICGYAAFRGYTWGRWGACFIGIWLQLAPLILWAPNAFLYLNDTMVGIFAIAFSIIIPGVPGEMADTGPEIPAGWSYNPSSWAQRLPILALATLGWFMARYMAAYQLGYLDNIWDPFFGDGTMLVITSAVSKAFPVSDAGLGAAAYTMEALMAVKGGTRRWRTEPWLVVCFGILVVPLGFTSILLVIFQPLLVGHWCGWCLLTAICGLLMIAFTIDEVVAVCRYLRETKRNSPDKFWHVFWHGGTQTASTADTRSPPLDASLSEALKGMVWGNDLPWNLVATGLIGAWLMAAPEILDTTNIAANIHYIIGALTVTFSVIATAEVARGCRYVNMLFGAMIVLTALLAPGETTSGLFADLGAGALLIALSIPRGNIKESYFH